MKPISPLLAGRLLTTLALLASGAASLHAEDVCLTTGGNNCPPSCPYGLTAPFVSPYLSAACTNIRSHCAFGITNTAAWLVTPTLANRNGTYKIFVTKGPADDCSPDIIVNMTALGGALADASGTAQTNVATTAFQKANSTDCWTLVGYITNNNTNQPNVTFTYASGAASRFYMDAVWFQAVDGITNAPPPARITQVLYGDPLTIAGTGPVGHPFALVSSTNVAKALNQWTAEQTNRAGTGAFSFSVTPGTARARFFRVITQ